MDRLVLVLAHVLPQRDVGLGLLTACLSQDPPMMPIQGHLLQGRLVQQGLQVADRRPNPILDASEGQVEVGASQGCVPGPCIAFKDPRQELVARSEPSLFYKFGC